MGRLARMFVSSEIYLVTARCFQARLLLRPSKETNEVLGGVLARALRLTGVELFAFHFASNHVHLLVRAPDGNLPRFMQHLLTNISKKVGALVGWRGAFWERRYSAEPVLDDTALLGRVRYVLSHPVKDGLLRSCAEWPGLSSLSLMSDGKPRAFSWFNWTRRSNSCSPVARARFAERWAEREELRLAKLPISSLQTSAGVKRFLREAIQTIEEEGARQYRKVLGRAGVLRQHPHHRPARPSRAPRPLCHTSLRQLLEAFRDRYRSFLAAFHQASARWRAGDLLAQFPEHAIRPFLWPEWASGQPLAGG
jgi:REP element-mobilizing transposase RayT